MKIIGQIKLMDIFVIKNNKVYDIEYYSLPENYDKYLALIQKMIESFKIMDLNLLAYENPTRNLNKLYF